MKQHEMIWQHKYA